MMKLISVIIPTFNRKEALTKAIKSVVDQSYQNWELLIVDDGSTDGTIEFIQTNFSDERIKLLSRPKDRKKGANTCRNIGIENSSGEFVAFLDSDDSWHKDHLMKKISYLNNSESKGVFSGFKKITNFGEIVVEIDEYNEMGESGEMATI